MPDAAPVRGLWCATLTPIAPEGGVDHARLAAHVRALLAQGVEGVAPFGTTGEGQSFSVAERRAGLDALFASGIAAMHIVAATGCAALTDTLELTRHALSVGCPRCLILPPFFFKDVGDDAIFAYFAEVIERIADPRLRIYLYHIPQVTAVPIRPPIVARLAGEFPGIIAGVKDSSGDLANTLELLERVPQLSILVGHEPHLPRAMRNEMSSTARVFLYCFTRRTTSIASDPGKPAAWSSPVLSLLKAMRAVHSPIAAESATSLRALAQFVIAASEG